MFKISKPFRLVYLHNVENSPKAEKAAEKQPTKEEKEEAKEVNKGIDEKIARIEDLIKQSPVSEKGKEKIRAKYKGILAKRETELKKLDEDAHEARLEIRIRTLVDLNEFENKELKPTVAGVWAEERVARPVSAPSAPKPTPTPKPALAKPTPSPAPSLAPKPAENLAKPSSPEITPPSPGQMAQIMQQNFGELLGDKSWSLDAGLFDSPQYNASSKTVEIKYPGQNVNQITFVYHMDSKTRELQFKGDISMIVNGSLRQLLIDQWEKINGKTYGSMEEAKYKMPTTATTEKSAEVAAKGRKTPTEILKKDGGGWKEKVTDQEWRDITLGLKNYKQSVPGDTKKLLKITTGFPEYSIPNKVPVAANFDIDKCQKISKPTIEIARQMGCNDKELEKVEVAIKKGELPPKMDVPNPPVGSIIVAYDIFKHENRMSVFTEQGPKEVKMV